MTRSALFLAGFIGVLGFAGSGWAQRLTGGIIPEHAARQHGLHRAWVMQIDLDPGRGRIEHVTLNDGLLMIQTDQATLQVLDAETRRLLWAVRVGAIKYPTSPPMCDENCVVSTNGGTFYMFDRRDGRLLLEKELESVPSSGPMIGGTRVYVPLVTGMVVSFRLPQPGDDELPAERIRKNELFHCQVRGIADSTPIYTANSVVWGTSYGDVYACNDRMEVKFRFRTRDAISAPLSYYPPFIYAASRDGYVYALRDEKGYKRWQFSAGNPVVEQPVVIGDALYVVSEVGDLFKLNRTETEDKPEGLEQWSVKGIQRFVAAGKDKLYVVDLTERLLVLDARTGARLGALPLEYLPLKIVNNQTDRIYLGSPSGLIQCLHERELVEPFQHALPKLRDDAEKPKEGGAAKPAAEGETEEEPEMPSEDEDNPFAKPEE